MQVMTTQYLQVPKALPQRKSRSRSRTRPREAIATTPDTLASPPFQLRPQTPPRPSLPTESCSKPFANVSTNGITMSKSQKDSLVVEYMEDVRQTPQESISRLDVPAAVDYNNLAEDVYTMEQCKTPPPVIPLRQKLVGAWKLESYIAYPTANSTIQRPTFPMTKNVTGFIMYTPDGYVSAQMLIPGQQSFKRGEGEEPQWAEAGKRCFAYCGPYYISDEGLGREETLRHTFQVCNLPGWIGDIQIRTHRFEEDGQVLVLGSEQPSEIKGDKRVPVLKWRRARDNSNSVPPPPTPQIKISGPGEP
ncbi:Hypothetical protein R9X50_00321700 [Acrodontium crateriforme]|uniref:Lipocalin-like domain-containing protein n=1 Tax=Acrodontium crateriforme TaxID=150365 RepID=A0AAQ3R9Q6_9PEZI|nr:Hypothetical protein R9X50_00321700 [Acrodontium crateriforme]